MPPLIALCDANVLYSFLLPDPDDRHVLAAALRVRADVIVMINLSDFPSGTLTQYGVEVQHPDAFVLRLIEMNQPAVLNAVRRQRAKLTRPPMTARELLSGFERVGLLQTVAELRPYETLL